MLLPCAMLLIADLQLPDMDFPINAMAEGRILVPWEHRQYPNLTEGEFLRFAGTLDLSRHVCRNRCCSIERALLS